MNALQQDIISVIRKHGASRTTDICEHLMDLGYGASQQWDEYRSHITKTISKMKAEHKVIGEDRPNPGTKPVRYWALPELDHPEDKLEMASDVADIERAHGPSLSLDEMLKQFEHEPDVEIVFDDGGNPDYKPSTVAFPKSPMSAAKILREFANLGFDDDRALGAFMDGIAAAERHHGIAE